MKNTVQEIEATHRSKPQSAQRHVIPGHWIFVAASFLVLVLLLVLPPLISISRYQHRIATSISTSLGRPVHFDRASLNLLPIPGFTITNFVVEEDPAFGTEPIIRADSVEATLRVSSLWRRRIEVSRISFTDPSINLVHDTRGKWNFEGILLQAAHIETAPTPQPTPGHTPRFPYIEASGARFNLKQGYEKTPFSISEADFALWLPEPQSWKMRLRGRPVRTDTSVSDAGSLQLEATLGRASTLASVPIQVDAAWRGAPLGEASRLILRRDLGMRGEATLSATVTGNLSQNKIRTDLEVNQLRRADFVPDQPLSLHVECAADATRLFHTLSAIRCSWPVPDSNGGTVALAGSIADVTQPTSADLELGTSPLPLSVLLTWLRVASSRLPQDLSASGLLSGSFSYGATETPAWVGQVTVPDLRLSGAKLGPMGVDATDLLLRSAPPSPSDPHASVSSAIPRFVLSPLEVPLGGRDPASLEGLIDRQGYTLHLSGMVVLSRLLALAASVPQLGDGLAKALPSNRGTGPVRVELSAHRDWGGDQIWTDNLARPEPSTSRMGRSISH